jgi:hypothetical protein
MGAQALVDRDRAYRPAIDRDTWGDAGGLCTPWIRPISHYKVSSKKEQSQFHPLPLSGFVVGISSETGKIRRFVTDPAKGVAMARVRQSGSGKKPKEISHDVF